MATLDVAFVLDCEEFRTQILLRRSNALTDDRGIGRGEETWLPLSAVVIADGGRDLIQTGEGDSVAGDITVYSRYDLTAGGAEVSADIIAWDNTLYKVINAQPWRYGQGFTRSICKQMENNPSLLGEDSDCNGSALDPQR